MNSQKNAAIAGLAALATAASAQSTQAVEKTDWSYLQSRAPAVAQKRLGTPVSRGENSRVIDIASNTRWINVTQDETIRIRNGSRSFDWQFSTWRASGFALAQIAPPDFGANPDLYVYVAPNPLLNGS